MNQQNVQISFCEGQLPVPAHSGPDLCIMAQLYGTKPSVLGNNPINYVINLEECVWCVRIVPIEY
jgi:hypothetical protein